MTALATRPIGHRHVSAFALGGAAWSLKPAPDVDRAVSIVVGAIEQGVTLLDTATAYIPAGEPGHNERLFARAVSESGRSDILISTKVGQTRVGDTFPLDGRPATIRKQCEASLRTLGRERIDLLYLHSPDPEVPIEESVGTLGDLRTEGKIDLIGVSNVSGHQLERAVTAAPLSAVQNKLSPFDTEQRDLVTWCADREITFLAYSPLGGWEHPSYADALPGLHAVAAERGTSPEQVALAWELSLSARLIPVLGASRPETIRSSLEAADLTLTDADLQAIEESIRAHRARTP